MRSRPEIELRIPRFVHPGDDVPVTVVLTSGSETPIERVEISLMGFESARLPDNSRVASSRTFHTAIAVLREEGTLAEGTHTLEGSLELPPEMPASYVGFASDVRYSVKARVVIPWWPDAEQEGDLMVKTRRVARPARLPVSVMTERGDRPFLEIALDDRSFTPGDEITGAVAFGNVRGHSLRGMDLSLVGRERLRIPGWSIAERLLEAHRNIKFINVQSSDEGREIPIRIPVPEAAMPSFDEGLIALEWAVEARLEVSTMESLTATLPVVLGIYDRGAGGRSSGRPRSDGGPARSPVGSDRWRGVWSSIASQSGLSLDSDDLRLTGVIGGIDAMIELETEGEKRGALVGELEWPSLGIDLHVAPAGLSFALFVPDDELSRRYRIKSREPAQSKAFLTPSLSAALLAIDSFELNDSRARFWARGPAHDERFVAGFIELIGAVAAAAREAALYIPPPALMTEMFSAWRAFADELGGRLEVGSMSIREGRIDGASFSIETRFGSGSSSGAAPVLTVVELALEPPLPNAFDMESAAALASAPAGVREIVASIRGRASALRVNEASIELELPAPLADPASLRDVMRAALALAQRLAGDHKGGPYR